MASMVTIGDMTVDMEKPCDVAKALQKAELIVAAGGSVAMTRFGEDEVRWSSANLGALRELLGRYERSCAASEGRRLRYAKTIRFSS